MKRAQSLSSGKGPAFGMAGKGRRFCGTPAVAARRGKTVGVGTERGSRSDATEALAAAHDQVFELECSCVKG